MNRLGMSVALVLSLVAGCVATDQPPPSETGTSTQDLTTTTTTTTTATLCMRDDTYSCLFPTPWTQNITAENAYWAVNANGTAAKVMNVYSIPTKADPTTGAATAYYVWMIAGWWDGSNTVFRVYEVPATQLTSFNSLKRYNFDGHEVNANPLLFIWDGGAGGTNGGTPINPVGPRGFPWITVNGMTGAANAFRSAFANAYNQSAGSERATGVGIAAP
jgi:hypothetical protein